MLSARGLLATTHPTPPVAELTLRHTSWSDFAPTGEGRSEPATAEAERARCPESAPPQFLADGGRGTSEAEQVTSQSHAGATRVMPGGPPRAQGGRERDAPGPAAGLWQDPAEYNKEATDGCRI